MASYGKYSANARDFVNTSPMCNQEAGGRHHIHALWQVGEAISAGLLGVKNQAAVDTIDLTPHEWGQQLVSLQGPVLCRP